MKSALKCFYHSTNLGGLMRLNESVSGTRTVPQKTLYLRTAERVRDDSAVCWCHSGALVSVWLETAKVQNEVQKHTNSLAREV